MGESTTAVTQALEKAVDTVRKALWRVKPAYPLALRVLLASAIASAEYVFDVVPVPTDELKGPQVALDKAAKEALKLPLSFPKVILHGPLSRLGMGVPELAGRFQVRRLSSLLKALNSRSVYVREAVRS